MVRVTIVGGAGRVGRAIAEELGAQGRHEVILWTRRNPSEHQIRGVDTVQVTDYSYENLVKLLEGTRTVLAFFNPMSDPGSRKPSTTLSLGPLTAESLPGGLEKGEFKSPWVPSYAPNLPPETIRDVVVPLISGWALGIYKGVADVSPAWNERFSDIKYQTVEEMLRGAWARLEGRKEAQSEA